MAYEMLFRILDRTYSSFHYNRPVVYWRASQQCFGMFSLPHRLPRYRHSTPYLAMEGYVPN